MSGVDTAGGMDLPDDIVAQLTLAADNLEAAKADNARLVEDLRAQRLSADQVIEELSASATSLANEVAAHEATRAALARVMAGSNEVAEVEVSADWLADGIFVMLTSKIPDATGSLAPRGRLAIIGDERHAADLVESKHARPATRADLARATRPPVRI